MREIIPGIRHHHEKWRGGGYPDGLQGEHIPVIARIIGVADAFDAMTTNRPYQKGMTFEKAAARLNELCPSVYEPAVMDAFNRAYHAGAFLGHQQTGRRSQAGVNAAMLDFIQDGKKEDHFSDGSRE